MPCNLVKPNPPPTPPSIPPIPPVSPPPLPDSPPLIPPPTSPAVCRNCGSPVCIRNSYDLDNQVTERFWVNHEDSSIQFSNRWGGFTTSQVAKAQGYDTHDYQGVKPTDDCWLAPAGTDGLPPLDCLYSTDSSVEFPYQSCRGPGSEIQTPDYVTYKTWFKCYSGVCADRIKTTSSFQASTTASTGVLSPGSRSRKLQTQSETTGTRVNVRLFLHPSRAAFENEYGTNGELSIRSDFGTGASLMSVAATLKPQGANLCGASSVSSDSTNPMYTGQFGCTSNMHYFDTAHNDLRVPSSIRWDLAIVRSASDVTVLGSPAHENSISVTQRGTTIDLFVVFTVTTKTMTVGHLTHPLFAFSPPPPVSVGQSLHTTVKNATVSCESSADIDVTGKFQSMIEIALANGQDALQCMGNVFGGDETNPYMNVWDIFLGDPCPGKLKSLRFSMTEASGCAASMLSSWYSCIDLKCIIVGSPPASPPQPLPPGVGIESLTIWMSDNPYVRGDRAASIPTGTDRRRNIIPIHGDRDGNPMIGQYWTLQSYALHEKLRIDGFRIWGIAPSPPSPPPRAPPPPSSPPSPPPPPPRAPGGFDVSLSSNQVYRVTPYLSARGEYMTPLSGTLIGTGATLVDCDFPYSGPATSIQACTPQRCAEACASHATAGYSSPCGGFEHIKSLVLGKQRCRYWQAPSIVLDDAVDNVTYDAAGTPYEFYTLDAMYGRRLRDEEQEASKWKEEYKKRGLYTRPRHQPQSFSEDDPSEFHWWNRLETHNGGLYPYRNMPGLDTASAAASLAVALSISNASETGEPTAHLGHNITIVRPCEKVNCTHGGRTAYSAWIYEQPEVDIEAFWVRDDLVHMTWLVSRLVEPAVHVIYSKALYCVSPELCADKCEACPPAMRAEVPVEELLRQVEGALGESNLAQRDPIECVQSPVCLEEVAHYVARKNGASEAAPAAFDEVAAANAELATGFLEKTSWHDDGEPFNTTLWLRHGFAKAHRAAIKECCSVPAKWHVVPGSGRRLREEPPEKNNVRPSERIVHVQVARMYDLTAEVCTQLNQSNFTGATTALYAAIQQWARLGGEGNSRTNPTEQFCSDCDRVNHTQSCQFYFSLVSSRVNKLRVRKSMTSDEAKATRRKLIEAHVRKKAEGLCCARFEEGGREECAPKYCAYVMKDVAAKRIAMVSQHAHRTNHSKGRKLTVDALTGIDYLNSENHIDPDCRPGNKSLLGLSEAECFGRR